MKGLAFTYAEALGLLKQLISEHDCKKRIDLELSPSLKRTLGQTQQRRGTGRFLIRLSAYLSAQEMHDTLRHEFAHVMAGLKKGHSESWKNWAREVGAEPKRCAPQYPALTPLHTYACPTCEKIVIRRANRLRLEEGWVCRNCRTPAEKFIHAFVDPIGESQPPTSDSSPSKTQPSAKASAPPKSKRPPAESTRPEAQLPLLL